jgi:hypothetical protein
MTTLRTAIDSSTGQPCEVLNPLTSKGRLTSPDGSPRITFIDRGAAAPGVTLASLVPTSVEQAAIGEVLGQLRAQRFTDVDEGSRWLLETFADTGLEFLIGVLALWSKEVPSRDHHEIVVSPRGSIVVVDTNTGTAVILKEGNR